MSVKLPRIIIAGLSGDSGKTLISLGLISTLRNTGREIAAFKKGPDYIDASWLSRAAGRPAHNLDTYMMGSENVYASFVNNSAKRGLNVIEGNRGLFDGMNVDGEHSTAELAKILKAPVILVMDVTKVTRTAAALIKGCIDFDTQVKIEGVILNRVAGARHSRIVSESIEKFAGVPVLGALPKLDESGFIPGRHLGLVTPEEYNRITEALERAASVVSENIKLAEIGRIADEASELNTTGSHDWHFKSNGHGLRIGYFCDSAFTFYYPENLDVLKKSGAELVKVSSLDDAGLPPVDALYIGGGFPETHLPQLSRNRSLMSSIKMAAEDGLPIYAECGGLIYLAESLLSGGREIPMAGVLPVKVELMEKPQGHGYMEATVDAENPYYPVGAVLRGHEFHYTKLIPDSCGCASALKVNRGVGCFHKRDGLIKNNVFAAYMHIHALGTPDWADGLLRAAKNFKRSKIAMEVSAI